MIAMPGTHASDSLLCLSESGSWGWLLINRLVT